jgi:enoyl-CoA hydratase/carnithine racemase
MRLHLLNSIRKYSYKNLNIAQPYLNEGYFIHSAPGLRLIELNDPKNGNILTSKLVEAISTKLLSYSDNMIVQAVMFHSFARNKLFSHGVKSEEFKNDPKKLLQSLHKLSTTIESFDKPTLASYSGNLNATALGGIVFPLLNRCLH